MNKKSSSLNNIEFTVKKPTSLLDGSFYISINKFNSVDIHHFGMSSDQYSKQRKEDQLSYKRKHI